MDVRSTSEGMPQGGSGGVDTALLDRSLFQPYLEAGEKILWAGRPGPIHFLAQGDLKRIRTMVLVIAGLSLCFAASRPFLFWSGNHELVIRMSLIPIYAFGALLAGASAFMVLAKVSRIRVLRRRSYVLTDRRALSLDRKKRGTPEEVELSTIDRLHHRARLDGSGLIVFGYKMKKVRRKYTSEWVEVPRLMFEDISDIAFVLRLAEDALAKLELTPVPLRT